MTFKSMIFCATKRNYDISYKTRELIINLFDIATVKIVILSFEIYQILCYFLDDIEFFALHENSYVTFLVHH